MKLKESVIISKMNNQYILVDSDTSDTRFNGLIKLNETSKDIVEAFMVDTTKQEVINKIKNIYNVSDEKLQNDVDKIVEELEKTNLLNN